MSTEKHPLNDFLYCPHCGANTFTINDTFSKRCESCGFIFYANAAAATVAVIINNRNELLCTRRAKEPAMGTLDLPGGFVDPGESVTEGLCREVIEELGTEITYYKFLFSRPNLYPYCGHGVYTADSFFSCRIAREDLIEAGDDASEICWIPLDKLNPKEFGLDSIRQGIEYIQAHPELNICQK